MRFIILRKADRETEVAGAKQSVQPDAGSLGVRQHGSEASAIDSAKVIILDILRIE